MRSGTTRRPLVLVAAVARNGVIGAGPIMPWRLPSDLKHFRARTMGKPVVLGRKTYQSIGRVLSGRTWFIVTRDPGLNVVGAHIARSLADAVAAAELEAARLGADEICVAGGGEIYAQAMPQADRLAITEVALTPEGDSHFPAIDPSIWRETARSDGFRTSNDDADFAFVDYVRRQPVTRLEGD